MISALVLGMVGLGPLVASTRNGDGDGSGSGSGWLDSGSERVAVLELYTSEGCSSCPPAEKWLGELRDHPQLWKRIVPLNFHVTYWDQLGWPDRFASKQFTSRQYSHVSQLGLGSAYTPGFFLNGQEWRGFFQRETPKFPGGEAGRLRLRREGDLVKMEFTPPAQVARASEPPGALSMKVAILGFELASDVRAGENRGRRLEQNFVALGLSSVEVEAKDGRWTATLPLPLAESEWPAQAAIAGWVEHADDPAPLQAVGGPLTRR